MIAICSSSYGQALSAGMTNLTMVQTVGPLITLPIILLSGYMVNLDTVSPAMSWVQYISPPHYGFTAIVVDEFPFKKTFPFSVPRMQGMYMSYATCLYCLTGLTIGIRIIAFLLLRMRSKESVQ
mmetsp:Transcript_37699/g.27403  ORF Transcript_37699/g.27403 Transcript_37699/m.27403 type:complete len:124 (-) Transcript_37699:105-476(-)